MPFLPFPYIEWQKGLTVIACNEIWFIVQETNYILQGLWSSHEYIAAFKGSISNNAEAGGMVVK